MLCKPASGGVSYRKYAELEQAARKGRDGIRQGPNDAAIRPSDRRKMGKHLVWHLYAVKTLWTKISPKTIFTPNEPFKQ